MLPNVPCGCLSAKGSRATDEGKLEFRTPVQAQAIDSSLATTSFMVSSAVEVPPVIPTQR